MVKGNMVGYLCIIGTTVGYALVPSLSFMAFREGVVSETVLFDKFLFATILIWSYIFLKKLPARLNKDCVNYVTLVSFAYLGINTSLYLSFNYISGSLATIISFTFPVMVLTVEMIRGTEKVNIIKIIAVITTVCGLGMIVWAPGLDIDVMGASFALLCAVCYTIYTLGLSAKPLKNMNSIVIAGYIMLTSTIINGVRCGVTGNPMISFSPYVFILAVACAFAPVLLYCVGVRLIGPCNASLINTFEPVLACVFGYVLIGDLITLNMMIGGAVVVTSVIFVNIYEQKHSTK